MAQTLPVVQNRCDNIAVFRCEQADSQVNLHKPESAAVPGATHFFLAKIANSVCTKVRRTGRPE